VVTTAGPAVAAPADRDAAVAAWVAVQQDRDVPAGWTGSVEGCEVGTESAESLAATLHTFNTIRDFAGLAPVSFDPALNRKALAASLMMTAADDLSHEPGPDWPCYSADGDEGAGSSNLSLGYSSGADSTLGFVDEAGDLGHRRWVLDPRARVSGSGFTGRTHALYTFGPDTASVAADTTVAWPPPGWVPRDWVFPVWSLAVGGDGQTVEFQNPQVTVTSDAGPLPVTEVSDLGTDFGFGRTLSWGVGLAALPAGDQRLQVNVSGVVVDGRALPVSYVVDVFEPPGYEPPPVDEVSFVSRPTIKRKPRGAVRKGTLLKAKATVSGGEVTGYQWLRDGRPITGAVARTYRVRRADRRRRLACRVTATSPEGAIATRKTRAVSVARR
jgi:hypothetical protein